jgi:DNA recombination protein RmuC
MGPLGIGFVVSIAIITTVAALIGALAGVWIGNRRNSGDAALSQALSALIEQTAKTAREDIATLRTALVDTERALGTKLGDSLQESSRAQTDQIESFRKELKDDFGNLATSMTKLGTEVPAALETAAANAKVEASNASKTLLTELAAAFRQHGIDQGTKIDGLSGKVEASTATVAKALGEFRVALSDGLGDVRTTVTRIGGEMTTTLAENQVKMTKALTEDLGKLGTNVDTKITEMRAGNEAKLLEIQGVVDQKLQEGIEKRMTESFAKITNQFAEVQQAVGEVRNVAGQVGDLKRLFSNVKSRGGWGEAQVKATLDDILPAHSYEVNKCVNPATSDTVEFALKMPLQGGLPVYLSVDAKFPIEDYSRLIDAIEISDLAAEKSARTALEARIRSEAKKIQSKYIAPPHTVEWAVLYLPSEGLYAEVTRNNELTELIHREHRVVVMGPSMLAVMLRTIQLGHYTLAIGQKADIIGQILGAVKHEMVDFSNQFRILEKNVQALGNNIKKGRTRANVISRKLKGVAALEGPAAAELLEMPTDEELAAEAIDDGEFEAAA